MKSYKLTESEKLRKYWLIGALFSFGYELPVLMVSSLDKVNPRLFDVFFIVGLVLFRQQLFKSLKNPIFSIWTKMVGLMVVCVAVYITLLPIEIAAFSVYYLWKYIEGWLFIKMLYLCKDNINFELIRKVMISVGAFVGFYCFLQYLNIIPPAAKLTDILEVNTQEGSFLGPYSSTYFPLAQIVPLCFLFACSKMVEIKNRRNKVAFILLMFLVAFPALTCGSRTAMAFLFLSSFIYFWASKRLRELISLGLTGFIFILLFVLVRGVNIVTFVVDNSNTLQRSESLEDNESQSVGSRAGTLFSFDDFNSYDYKYIMPFVGGGFYVAPSEGDYRIGYGAHNNFMFAYEQLGIVGLFLFLSLFLKAIKKSYKSKSINTYAPIVLAFSVGLAVVSVAGQTFWRGFGNGNMNTLVVFMMTLSAFRINNKALNNKV